MYIYSMHGLPVVQDLDFSLIGQKTRELLGPHTNWLQSTYLTSAAIR